MKKELLSQLDKLYWRYENCHQFQSKIRETVLELRDVKEENICESLCWEKRICDAVATDIDSLVLKKEELQKEKDSLYLLAFDNSDVDNDISMDSLNGTLLSKKEARDKYYKINVNNLTQATTTYCVFTFNWHGVPCAFLHLRPLTQLKYCTNFLSKNQQIYY